MQETEECSNCHKQIAIVKAATHFGYCRRNIIKCSTCGEMYDKNFNEEHELQFHKTQACTHCKLTLKQNDVATHEATCEKRPKFCQYCELNVPTKQYASHLKQCEARTTPCEQCGIAILNKLFAVHAVTCRKQKQKIKTPIMANKIKQNPEYSLYEQQDSLSKFWKKEQIDQEKQKEKHRNDKQKRINGNQQPNFKKESKKDNTKQYKKQTPNLSTKPKNNHIKKQEKQQQNLSRQHFYNNYFGTNTQNINDLEQYFDFEDSGYLPSQSFYKGNNYQNQQHRTPSQYDFIDPDQQLIQQTLYESSQIKKKSNEHRKFQQNLPADFFSQDLMSKSFYNDILQIQKQNAILQDLSKNKSKARKDIKRR